MTQSETELHLLRTKFAEAEVQLKSLRTAESVNKRALDDLNSELVRANARALTNTSAPYALRSLSSSATPTPCNLCFLHKQQQEQLQQRHKTEVTILQRKNAKLLKETDACTAAITVLRSDLARVASSAPPTDAKMEARLDRLERSFLARIAELKTELKSDIASLRTSALRAPTASAATTSPAQTLPGPSGAISNANQIIKRSKNRVPFAEVLRATSHPPTNRFTVLSTVYDDDAAAKLIDEIQSDQSYAHCGNILNVSRKTPRMLFLAVQSPTTATCIKNKIAEKYGTQIVLVDPPADNTMIVKVAGCSIDATTPAAFLANLKKQNSGFDKAVIERSYDITAQRPYRNFVIRMPIPDAAPHLERGKVAVNVAMKNIFEVVDPLQCRRCNKYGHTSFNCSRAQRCRKCGSTEHLSIDCTSLTDVCSNCIEYNSRPDTVQKLNTRHRVTSDLCPIRVTRIDSLKHFLTNRKN